MEITKEKETALITYKQYIKKRLAKEGYVFEEPKAANTPPTNHLSPKTKLRKNKVNKKWQQNAISI